MFRAKESSNRIELSQLVQDLLNFGVLGSLWLWGWGVWVDGGWGWLGVPPHMCTCTCTHARTCMHGKHDNFMQMVAPIGGIPLISLWCHTLSPPPTHIHPPPHPPGGTPRISQNSIALELIKIFQFCLKIWNLWRLPHPWVGVWFGGWVGGWVGWWVGSGQNTKNLKIVDWIKIIQFCLKIYDL